MHRGSRIIFEELKDIYTWCTSESLVKEELKHCMKCKKYNPKRRKRPVLVTSYYPGEKIAIDIVGPIKSKYIITGIDYFTRKGWSKVILSRDSSNVVEFIEFIHNEMRIHTLVMDQSKENLSNAVRVWAENNNVELHFTSPFHHQSNGRVERFNRTLQEGIYKIGSKKNLRDKVNKVLEVYNSIKHTSIGISPNEAIKIENHKSVKEAQHKMAIKHNEKYDNIAEEDKLSVGDVVLIKTECNRKKSEPLFKETGVIDTVLPNNAYYIKSVNNSYFKRHASQLKKIVDAG